MLASTDLYLRLYVYTYQSFMYHDNIEIDKYTYRIYIKVMSDK